MATLTPTLTLASTDVSADETLNLTVTDSLSVLGGSTTFQVVTSTTAAVFLANGGYTKSYVFLQNLSSTDGEIIYIRTATGGTDILDLEAGEFAFFPWSADVDLAYDAATGTPTLEVRVYQDLAA
jgi:aspartate oxidase